MDIAQSVALSCMAIAAFTTSADREPPARVIGNPPTYHIVRRINIDTGAYDLVAIDEQHRRFYGANYQVIDVDSLVSVGTVPPHTGHAFAIAPELGRGLGRRGVFFDLTSLRPIGHIDISADEGVVYDRASHRAVFLNNTLTVVDVAQERVVDSVLLFDGHHSRTLGAVSDGRGLVYISLWHFDDDPANHESEIAVLDARKLKILRYWQLPGCPEIRAISIDPRAGRLFASCREAIVVVSADNGKEVAHLPTTGAAGEQSAFDERLGVLLAVTGTGHLDALYELGRDKFQLITVDSIPGARGRLTLDSRTHRVFLPVQKTKDDSVGVVVVEPNGPSGAAASVR
jgi:hypothetical protein